MGGTRTILVIEDNPGDARLIREMLFEQRERPELIFHERLSDGIGAIDGRHIDVILLDLALPDSFGLETFRAVRDSAPRIPIIILTGLTDEAVGIQTVQMGAQDYLIKGQFDPFQLDRAIRYAIERKRSEIALQESEKKYRDLVENAASAIIKMDVGGNITFFNEFSERFFGYREDEVIGKSVAGTIVPTTESTGRDLSELIRNICSNPAAYENNENENITKDGRRVWMHWTNKTITDESGRPSGVLCVGNDITERKAAQEALKEQEETLRGFMNAITDTAYLMDADGRILQSNPSLSARFNRSREEIIGKSVYDLIPAEQAARRKEFINEILLTGIPGMFDDSRDGKQYTTRIYPVHGTTGTIDKLAVISMDITERKEMEMKLRRRNKQLSIINRIIRLANSSLILAEMLEIVMNMTLDLLEFDIGSVYLKNPDGVHADLITTKGVSDYYCEKNKKIRIRDYPNNIVFFAGQPRYVENTPDQEPGMIDAKMLEDLGAISYVSIPLMADSVVLGALCLGRSEKYGFSEWEKMILESIGKEIGGTILRGLLQDQLEEAYEETSLYIDIIMNDIRRTNDAMREHVEVVREMLHGPAKNYIRKLDAIIGQSNEIIRNVATLRRINDKKRGVFPVDLDAVISAEVAKYPGVDIAYANTGYRIIADELVGEIFSNLIGNSMKFGGPNVRIRISAAQQNGSVEVSIEDTGPGIPDEEKESIFGYFNPNSQRKTSRGLGLHISRLLAEHYGGSIRLEDRIPGNAGAGLRVRIQFTPESVNDGDAKRN